jgi:Tol biopolymer transport system component
MPHRHADLTNHRIEESDLWIISGDAKVRCQLTATPELLEVEPAWSPDGKRLVCRTEEGGVLLILNLTKSAP